MVLMKLQGLPPTEVLPVHIESTKFLSKAKADASNSRRDSRRFPGNPNLKRTFVLKPSSTFDPSSVSLLQNFAEDSVDSFHSLTEQYEGASPRTWNSIIARLVDHGLHAEGIEVYKQMLRVGTQPTPLTFSSLLKSCADTAALSIGRQIHGQTIVRGFSPNMILESALIVVYTRCGELENGRRIFEKMVQKNAITWNSMIRGYSQVGDNEGALNLFGLMQRDGILPDNFTFPALLAGACSERYLLGEFKGVHAYAIKVALERDCFVGSSLITMYSTNGLYENARLAFDDISSKDIGVWSSIIAASIKSGRGDEALRLFTQMLNSDFKPNQLIFSSLIAACAELSILEAGKQVFAHCLKSNDAMDTATKNSLITMYSNCGCIQEARRVFNSLENPNLISFNSMISACAQHGFPEEAVELLERLRVIGLQPDEITILNLLSAFNHAAPSPMAPRMFACFGRGSGGASSSRSPETNATADLTAEEQRRMGPVLVELFSSQGCGTSPEAEAVVSRLGRGELGEERGDDLPPVAVLGFHVEYWDYRGWRDPFGSSIWTVRQKAYVESLRLDTLYTPQVVVHGRAECIGTDLDAIASAVRSAPRFPSPTMQATFHKPAEGTLQVSFTGALRTKVERSGADVMVALYESGLVTDCNKGENKGRVLSNDYVVRRLEKLVSVKDISAKKNLSGSVQFTLWEGFHGASCGILLFVQNGSLQTFGVQHFQIPDTIL
ncbi:hypothetical protein Cni_G23856 [Canna indica]|uniref:Pentatricopeptide repeat-containing protein n=1 Tax=Canna indica TaxID=4628 RepID=A0AAQ3QNZ7_9LILI|nr:hypothetical protein Cni_G23856 [Canna indica]